MSSSEEDADEGDITGLVRPLARPSLLFLEHKLCVLNGTWAYIVVRCDNYSDTTMLLK